MAKLRVLLEIAPSTQQLALASVMSTSVPPVSATDNFAFAESLLADLPGLGVEISDQFGPVPMASAYRTLHQPEGAGATVDFSNFLEGPVANAARAAVQTAAARTRKSPKGKSGSRARSAHADVSVSSLVMPCEVTVAALKALESRTDVIVWPDSPISLQSCCDARGDGFVGLIDLARSSGGTDCRPFRPGVSVDTIRALLGVESIWRDGFRGQNVIVGILDEGVNNHYPVVGGHETPSQRRWGLAAIESHGSMCAADILVAAPAARIYDYPFLGQPSSGGALAMFQAVLERHSLDGTPHLTNNSYGYTGVPTQTQAPNHEIWNLNHPIHRKVREVVAAGIACFFAAGNCGAECPSGDCHDNGVGPGRSIHASNSLSEVITVAAVNSRHERVGYSSQGPGMFDPEKPDIAAYTHFFGNFGPDRPGGLAQAYDNGTSAATPVACGVGAALLSAFADLPPDALKRALSESAMDIDRPGRDFLTGAGVVNAAAAYQILKANGRIAGSARPRLPSRTGV